MRRRGASILDYSIPALLAIVILCLGTGGVFAQNNNGPLPNTPVPGIPTPDIPGLPDVPGLPNVPGIPGIGGAGNFEEVNVNASINCSLPGCRKISNERTIKSVNEHFQSKRIELEQFLISDIYRDQMLPALQHLVEQWTTGELATTQMDSNLTDAQISADTINHSRQATARAAAELQTSTEFCTRSTLTSPHVAIASSVNETSREITDIAGNAGSNREGSLGQGGPIDYAERMEEIYLNTTCNSGDFDGALSEDCRGEYPDIDIDIDRFVENFPQLDETTRNTVMASLVNNLSGNRPLEMPEELRSLGEDFQQLVPEMNRLNAIEANVTNTFSNYLALNLPGETEINQYVQAAFDQTGVDSQDGRPSLMSFFRANVRQARSPETLVDSAMVHERELLAQQTSNSGFQLSVYDQYYQSLLRETRNLSAAVGQMVNDNSTQTRENLINAAGGEAPL